MVVVFPCCSVTYLKTCLLIVENIGKMSCELCIIKIVFIIFKSQKQKAWILKLFENAKKPSK